MISKFDKLNLKNLRSEIDAALREVSNRNGISLGIGNISFVDDRFTCRLTGTSKSVGRIKLTDTFVSSGLIEGSFRIGDKFTHKTKTMTIIGYNPTKPKNSVEMSDQNGKRFCGSLSFVKSCLK